MDVYGYHYFVGDTLHSVGITDDPDGDETKLHKTTPSGRMRIVTDAMTRKDAELWAVSEVEKIIRDVDASKLRPRLQMK